MAEKKKREQATQARRQLLVETAAICFAEKGFHQTSMRDLAERAGVSLGNVYNHFDGKTDLIREIARLEAEGLQVIQSELSKIDDAKGVLDHFVLLYSKMCAEPLHAMLASEILSEGMRNPGLLEEFDHNRQKLLASLAETISIIHQTETSTSDVKPDHCAEFVLDLVEGLAMRFVFEGKKPSRSNLSALRSAIHRLVGIS